MASATTTTVGEIVLSGDLAGGTDANFPQLRASGVTPGTYNPAQRISVDSKGRIVSIGALVSADVSSVLVDATNIDQGVASYDSSFSVTSGVVTIPNASSAQKGVFSLGSGFTLNSGEATFDPTAIPLATSSTNGRFSVGYGLSVSSGVVSTITGITEAPATIATKGIVQPGTGLEVNLGVLTRTLAQNAVLGIAQPSNTNNMTIGAGGALDVGANISKLGTASTATKARVTLLYDDTSAFSAAYVPNYSKGGNIYVGASANMTVFTPSNVVSGGIYNLIVKNTTAGSITITFNGFLSNNGLAPATIIADSSLTVTFIVAGSSIYGFVTSAYS